MNIKMIIDFIEKIAPLEAQAEHDNAGWQYKSEKDEIKKVLVALEITRGVVDEAVAEGADLILTHHPFVYRPIRKIFSEDPSGYCLTKLAKNDISVYSSHTPFDRAKGGTCDYFLKKLGCKKNKPVADFVYMGELDKAVTLRELARKASELAETPGMVRVSGDGEQLVKKVAICTGSGGDLFMEARAAGADVYITGEINHHQAQDARELFFPIICAGHWGTEMQFVDNISAQLEKKFPGKLTIIKSSINQNPFDFMA